MDNNSAAQYDDAGNAKHYTDSRIESIIMMERIWGTIAARDFCEMNAFKYRMRAGKKTGQEMKQEFVKISWYEKMAKFFDSKIIVIPALANDENKTNIK